MASPNTGLLTSALLLAALPQHALTQPATDDASNIGSSNKELEEIVVTGQKIVRSLQEVQTSATVFNADRIEQEALFDLDDTLLRAPNVSVSNVATGFSLRGVDQGGVGFAGTGQTSQVYVDGLPLSFDGQQGAQTLWDVGQVEILLGPQSTIQGRNALSGAIIINTNDPTYNFETKLRAQIGNQETRRLSGAVNIPIVDDQIALRLAYDFSEYDGDVREITTGLPQEYEDSHTFRAKLLLEPEALAGLRVELTGEYIDTKFGEFNTVFATVPFDDPAFANFDPFGGETSGRVRIEEPETTKFLVNIQYEVNDSVTLVALGTFEDNFRDREFGFPGANGFVFTDAPADTTTYTGELRSEFDFGKITGWVGGYYFENEIVNTSSLEIPLAGLLPFPFSPGNSVVSQDTRRETGVENYAVFADFTYEFTDKISINLGARYDVEEFADSGNVGSVSSNPADCVVTLPTGDAPCTVLLGATNTPGVPADFEAFLPRGAIVYSFTPDISLGFSVARGYRAGGAVLQQNGLTLEAAIVPFDPEFTTNYELSLRTQSADGKWTVNANTFFTDWTDQQVTIPGPSGLPTDSFTENVGESELYGAEITVDYRPSGNFSAFATLGLLHTEFTDFPFAFIDGEFANLAGNEFPAAPGVTASAGFSYQAANGFYISGSGSYTGETESEVANLGANRNNDYFLVNGRLGLRFGPYDIYSFANNLFDERFVTRRDFAGVNTGTGAIDVRPQARFQVNQPRIVGVGVQAAF
ncbi:MAG: TonB-dependent receptor [Pseudomonadota bacterium]